MTGENYNPKPVGRLVVRGGATLRTVEKMLSEGAIPGMLAAIDNNDYIAKKCTSGTKPAGWICYEQTDNKFRPENYETPYVSGDVVAIAYGGDFDIVTLVAGDTSADITISIGDELISNGDGTLRKWVAGTDTEPPVARALESITIAHATPVPTARITVNSLI